MTTPPRYNWQRGKDWRRKGKILRTWLKFAFCKLTPQATVRRQGDACQTDVLRDLGMSPSVKFSPGWSKRLFTQEKTLLTLQKVDAVGLTFDRCPVEDDRLVLGKERPLITGSENHTVFIKVWKFNFHQLHHPLQNSIRFSYFGDHFHRNNIPKGRHICFYNFNDPESWLCNIFRLGWLLSEKNKSTQSKFNL